MLEIKFKVWDKENKKWIDDSDIAINQEGLLFIRYEYQVEFQSMSLTKSANFEIVFYTGKKDKNGKEIYEGYIFKGSVIEFKNGAFCWEDISLSEWDLTNWEISGNKWEDPELLK